MARCCWRWRWPTRRCMAGGLPSSPACCRCWRCSCSWAGCWAICWPSLLRRCDTVQAVGFMLSVGIFLSPILFPLTLFPAAWRWVLWLNPMTALGLGYQQLLLQGNLPPREVWAVAAVWVLLLAWLLDWVLRRSRDQLVDWL